MAQFLYIPFGSGGGGGSSQDRFAPKYLVGNVANGDSPVEYSTGGFYYFADPGTGVGAGTRLAAALLAADASQGGVVGDVWVRPGLYEVSATLNVPIACTVRGSGPSTLISSVANTISGALVSLSDQSSLRDVALAHTSPANAGVPAGNFGVVDLRSDGASALCENVQIAVGTGGFSGFKVFAGFCVSNTNGTGVTSLRCVRCEVIYGSNGTSAFPLFLVGYRMQDAVLELEDCDATRVASDGNANGSSVLARTDQAVEGQSSLRISGGKFEAPLYSIYWEGTQADYPVWISGVRIKSSTVGAFGGGIWIAKRARAMIDSVNVDSNLAPCVLFDATGGYDAFNVGSLSHSTLTSVSSAAWSSIGAPASGYHTILGNTYRSFSPPTSGPNDEVAHNITFP